MFREAPELGFDEDCKPAIESIRGRLVPKISPRRRHGILQLELGMILRTWARGRGEVGSEWRVYLLPDAGRWSSLVPDLTYYSFERLPKATPDAFRERPTIAPDLAVEILSPHERRKRIEEKIALYLAYGSTAVIVVDPRRRTLQFVGPNERIVFGEGETFQDSRFLGLTIDVAALFAAAD